MPVDLILTTALSLLFLGAAVLAIRRYLAGQRRHAREQSRRVRMLNGLPGEMRWRVFERDHYTCQRCGRQNDLMVDFTGAPPEDTPVRLGELTTRCVRCVAIARQSGMMD